MQSVITKEQAKTITGGRTPLVPVEYENAVHALTECLSIDDAKYWNDKADALAAWARIFRNDEAGRKAKQLKLHAYRRMGELAHDLKPAKEPIRAGNGRHIHGHAPGSVKLLMAHGFKQHQANTMTALQKIRKDAFNEAVNSPAPPSPTALAGSRNAAKHSECYRELIYSGNKAERLAILAVFCRSTDAKVLARTAFGDEAPKIRQAATVVTEWLDELEQYLPK